jgi:hypothetical protein
MERRSFKRVTVQATAEIEISVDPGAASNGSESCSQTYRGIVETIDMSLCGLSARIVSSPMDTARSFSPALAYPLVGNEIRAAFASSGITVWGKVVRYDPRNMLIAVVITRVSDVLGFRDLLSRIIFPCTLPDRRTLHSP